MPLLHRPSCLPCPRLLLNPDARAPPAKPLQPGENTCTAPLLSIIKWSGDIDVPVPPFGPLYEPHWAPWEDKADVAFFR